MKIVVTNEEGKKTAFISGTVIKVTSKTPTLSDVAIVTKRAPKGSDQKDEITNVAFTAPSNGQGQDFNALAQKMRDRSFIAVAANVQEKGEYENLYAFRVDLGPSYEKKSDAA